MKQSKPRPKASAKPKPDTRSAQFTLIGQIVEFLNTRGYFVWHQANHGRFDAEHAADRLLALVNQLRLWKAPESHVRAAIVAALAESWRKVPHTIKGVADIIGLHRTGIFVAIEVKIGSDRESDDQRAWRTRVQDFKGRALVVSDLAEFKRLFTQKKPAPEPQAVPGESQS